MIIQRCASELLNAKAHVAAKDPANSRPYTLHSVDKFKCRSKSVF